MRVSELSGDSTVRDVRYADGIASLVFEDYDTDRVFRLEVRTPVFYSEASAAHFAAVVRLLDLRDLVPIEVRSGRYWLPADFGRQMSLRRELAHLALGLRATEYPLLLVVRSDRVLLATPIASEDHVVLTELV